MVSERDQQYIRDYTDQQMSRIRDFAEKLLLNQTQPITKVMIESAYKVAYESYHEFIKMSNAMHERLTNLKNK